MNNTEINAAAAENAENKLNVTNFRIEPNHFDGFILIEADVSGDGISPAAIREGAAEYLDEDGDVIRSAEGNIENNQSMHFDEDDRKEIHDAMQAFIDAMPKAERKRLTRLYIEVQEERARYLGCLD